MDRLLSWVCALILAGGIAAGWDRHPPMGWHTKLLFWTVGFSLPDSLATQRDAALARVASAGRDLAQCHGNVLTLQAAVAAQNAAVDALGKEGEAKVAQSQRAASAARISAQAAQAHAQAILDAKPGGADLCAAANSLIEREAGE